MAIDNVARAIAQSVVAVQPTEPTDTSLIWVDTDDNTSDIITIDSELSVTSTNPIQNKVVKTAIDSLSETIANMFSTRDVLLDYTDTIGEKTFLKTKDNYKLIFFIMKCGQDGYEKTQVFYPAYLVSGLAIADSFATTSTFYYLANITANGINITTISSSTKLRIIGIK